MPIEYGLSITEQPVLSLVEYGVAFHYVARAEPPIPSSLTPSEEFSSFERDLLSYTYRGDLPLASQVMRVPNHLQSVQVSFPRELIYVSEGLTIRLLCKDADDDGLRRRENVLKASRTMFKSGLVLYHLILSPRPDSEKSAFNEYDFVKLAKLWEGGEGVDPDSRHRIDRLITFQGSDSNPLTLSGLARSVFNMDLPGLLPRLGTVQILTRMVPVRNRLPWSKVWEHIQGLKEVAAGRPSHVVDVLPQDELAFRAVKGVAGIMQGLLDFDRIDPNELSDVFSSVYLTGDVFIGVHKGSLISVSAADRAYEVAVAVGMSPYLLAPQCVLAHNEELLRSASLASEDALGGGLKTLDVARRNMQLSLDRHYLPNIFHYSTERMLFDLGQKSRGLRDRERALRGAMTDVVAELESRMSRRRRVAEDVIAGLLLVLSGASLKDMAPMHVVIPSLSIAALLYVVWRLRT